MSIQTLLKKVREDRLLEILSELVKRESENPPGREKAAALYIESFLRGLGLETERRGGISPERFNVLCKIPGKAADAPSFLFNGHIDVVPAGGLEKWQYPPFEGKIVEESGEKRLYGRGSSDMKGSIACMLHLCELLHEEKILPKRPIYLLFNVDEEHGALGMSSYVKDPVLPLEAAIVGEPTGGEIHLGHRGRMSLRVRFFGKSCHASMPSQGINALYMAMEFSRLCQRMDREVLSNKRHELLGSPSLVVTVIHGGIEANVIPDECFVEIDHRMIPGESTAEVLLAVEALAGEAVLGFLPEGRMAKDFYEIEPLGIYPPGEVQAEDDAVKRLQSAFESALGKRAEEGPFPATCEAGMLMEATGAPTLIAGAGDLKRAHQPNEFISGQELADMTKVYLAFFLEEGTCGH